MTVARLCKPFRLATMGGTDRGALPPRYVVAALQANLKHVRETSRRLRRDVHAFNLSIAPGYS